MGCRTLRFRGHNVALLCFKRAEGDLIHLLVIDRKAMKIKNNARDPQYTPEGDWMTATWQDDNHTYLIAAKSDRDSLAKYFSTS